MNNIDAPFCGIPPLPDDLWTRWLFDPVLGAGLLTLGALLIWKDAHRRAALAGYCGLPLSLLWPSAPIWWFWVWQRLRCRWRCFLSYWSSQKVFGVNGIC